MAPLQDRRLFQRLPMEVEVELYRSGHPMCLVRTEDLSNGGVLLVLDADERPLVGDRVQLRVSGVLGDGETAPLVEATVVRHAEGGVAVRFSGETEL